MYSLTKRQEANFTRAAPQELPIFSSLAHTLESIGTLSNEDGSAKDDSSENHISGLLFTSLYGSSGFCFFALNFVNRIEKRLNVSPLR